MTCRTINGQPEKEKRETVQEQEHSNMAAINHMWQGGKRAKLRALTRNTDCQSKTGNTRQTQTWPWSTETWVEEKWGARAQKAGTPSIVQQKTIIQRTKLQPNTQNTGNKPRTTSTNVVLQIISSYAHVAFQSVHENKTMMSKANSRRVSKQALK